MGSVQSIRNPIDVHVGKTLRKLRKLRGLTQVQLAAALHVSFQQLQKYEYGTNRLSAATLFEAARFLGVPLSAFFRDVFCAEPVEDSATPWPHGKAAVVIAEALPQLPLAIQDAFADLIHVAANSNDEEGD